MFGWSAYIRIALGAVSVLGLLWLGDAYGPHAWKLADREAADAARNAAIDYQAEHDEHALTVTDAAVDESTRQFRELNQGNPECLLSRPQADAVNVVRD